MSKIGEGNLFIYLMVITYILYIFLYLGLFYVDEQYTTILEVITQTYISLSLLYYFNPFSSYTTITSTMRRVIFSAGFTLLVNNTGNIIRLTRKTISDIHDLNVTTTQKLKNTFNIIDNNDGEAHSHASYTLHE